MNKIRGQSELSNELNSTNTMETSQAIKSIKESIKLGKNDLWSLCPILLYQLAVPPSKSEHSSGCITMPLLSGDEHHHEHALEADRKMGNFFSL